jgi:hypothetical protein
MIVEKRFPEGDQFPFARSDGENVQVEFVDPDAPAAHEPTAAAPARTFAVLGLSLEGPRSFRARGRQ